ncbi:Glycosyl_transferase family 2 protein [Hexamita inflata]|uniref:Glycosyl transferase family 2 protein n=1 Tax=Hexamita inflata TaxID=28002 RepID=A0AA86TQ44_9EUKA|nr:Glycosyl transferase family 2 protein [Hexamita inflata]
MNQQYNNYTVTIVDDGSTDNSSYVIKNYIADKLNIVYIQNKYNYGTFYSRYQATTIDSDYTLFLDADDSIVENTLQTLVDSIEGSEPDVVWFQMNGSDTFASNLNMTSGYELFSQIHKQQAIFTYLIGKMIKTEVLRRSLVQLNVLLANKLVLGEDFLTMCSILSQDVSVTSVPFVGYIHNVNSEQITRFPSQERQLQDYFSRKISLGHLSQIKSKLSLNFSLCSQIWWDFEPKFQTAQNCSTYLQVIKSWARSNCEIIARRKFIQFVAHENVYLKSCFNSELLFEGENQFIGEEYTEIKTDFESVFGLIEQKRNEPRGIGQTGKEKNNSILAVVCFNVDKFQCELDVKALIEEIKDINGQKLTVVSNNKEINACQEIFNQLPQFRKIMECKTTFENVQAAGIGAGQIEAKVFNWMFA